MIVVNKGKLSRLGVEDRALMERLRVLTIPELAPQERDDELFERIVAPEAAQALATLLVRECVAHWQPPPDAPLSLNAKPRVILWRAW